jgi:hypothetical protein
LRKGRGQDIHHLTGVSKERICFLYFFGSSSNCQAEKGTTFVSFLFASKKVQYYQTNFGPDFAARWRQL